MNKFAVSNIGWAVHDDPAILSMLRSYQVTGIEVAPTKIFPDWQGANATEARRYAVRMRDQGFELPAMQALLFGKPELQLLQPASHAELTDHFRLLADLAAAMDTKVLVFGSPKNRRRGQLSVTEAHVRAVDIFGRLAEICAAAGCCIGLEHNPVEYSCDYITNVADAEALVKAVNHRGLQLHLDIAGVQMCGGNFGQNLAAIGDHCHFHASEPLLEPLCDGVVDHATAISWLRDKDYTKWISIEMKQPANVDLLKRSVALVSDLIFK